MAIQRSVDAHAVVAQPALPLTQGCAVADGEGVVMGSAETGPAASRTGNDEVGDDAARAAGRVSEVQVVGAWVVEVHGLLHQAQAEQAGVEVDRALGVTADEGDVVDSVYVHAVRSSPTCSVISSRAVHHAASSTTPSRASSSVSASSS